MAAISTISSKAQITLPLEVRDRLGVKSGDRVEFVFEDGHTVIRPLREEGNPFEKYIGAFPAFSTRQEVLDWVSDLRDDEDRIADLKEIRESLERKGQ